MNKEQIKLQNFIDSNLDKIEGIYPTGILGKNGKWLIICPTLYSFNLKFEKTDLENKTVEVNEITNKEQIIIEKDTKKKKSKKK